MKPMNIVSRSASFLYKGLRKAPLPQTNQVTAPAKASVSKSSTSTIKPSSLLLASPAFLLGLSDSSDAIIDYETKENDSPNSCSTFPKPALSPRLKADDNIISEYRSFSPVGSPSPSDINNFNCYFESGVCLIPHPTKRAKGGEDAYMISDDMRVLGVADGVGGWGDIGVDPALYSKALMEGTRIAANERALDADPLQIMIEGYNYAEPVQGSSTCCVVALDGYLLQAANLGDSGFLVIRGNRIVYKSKEQQHSFNFPYQLGTGSSDYPEHATQIQVEMQPGDLVVVGTDGLWDNLYDHEIIELLSMSNDPASIAQLIARRAFMVANSKTILSPFARSARAAGYTYTSGGKLDDISVIVARVAQPLDISDSSMAA